MIQIFSLNIISFITSILLLDGPAFSFHHASQTQAVHGILKSLQEQHEINPTRKTRADITRIEARIQTHKKQKRAKQKAKRMDTQIASPTSPSVTDEKSAAQPNQ